MPETQSVLLHHVPGETFPLDQLNPKAGFAKFVNVDSVIDLEPSNKKPVTLTIEGHECVVDTFCFQRINPGGEIAPHFEGSDNKIVDEYVTPLLFLDDPTSDGKLVGGSYQVEGHQDISLTRTIGLIDLLTSKIVLWIDPTDRKPRIDFILENGQAVTKVPCKMPYGYKHGAQATPAAKDFGVLYLVFKTHRPNPPHCEPSLSPLEH